MVHHFHYLAVSYRCAWLVHRSIVVNVTWLCFDQSTRSWSYDNKPYTDGSSTIRWYNKKHMKSTDFFRQEVAPEKNKEGNWDGQPANRGSHENDC